MEPCPALRTKRSRLSHWGLAGLWRRKLVHRVKAAWAMPMGIPGWPELAACTPSADNMRMVLTALRSKSGSRSGVVDVC